MALLASQDAGNIVYVKLLTEDFERALSIYIDSAKPDPLARKQLEALSVRWDNGDRPSIEVEADGVPSSIFRTPIEPRLGNVQEAVEKNIISGALSLSGEYITATIFAECAWIQWRENDAGEASCPSAPSDLRLHSNNPKSTKEILHFILRATASITPKTAVRRKQNKEGKVRTATTSADDELTPGDGEHGNGQEDDGILSKSIDKTGRKEQRAATKISAGMIERLKKDLYVRRLLESSTMPTRLSSSSSAKGSVYDSKKSSKKGTCIFKGDAEENSPLFLCEAFIYQACDNGHHASEIEERVDVSEDATEGLRRSVMSMMDDNLSVVELLLSMPFLPQASSDDEHTTEGGARTKSSYLANRAALRLLEDAMFDACEKEGEEEIIDDLNISGQAKDVDSAV